MRADDLLFVIPNLIVLQVDLQANQVPNQVEVVDVISALISVFIDLQELHVCLLDDETVSDSYASSMVAFVLQVVPLCMVSSNEGSV